MGDDGDLNVSKRPLEKMQFLCSVCSVFKIISKIRFRCEQLCK